MLSQRTNQARHESRKRPPVPSPAWWRPSPRTLREEPASRSASPVDSRALTGRAAGLPSLILARGGGVRALLGPASLIPTMSALPLVAMPTRLGQPFVVE